MGYCAVQFTQASARWLSEKTLGEERRKLTFSKPSELPTLHRLESAADCSAGTMMTVMMIPPESGGVADGWEYRVYRWFDNVPSWREISNFPPLLIWSFLIQSDQICQTGGGGGARQTCPPNPNPNPILNGHFPRYIIMVCLRN